MLTAPRQCNLEVLVGQPITSNSGLCTPGQCKESPRDFVMEVLVEYTRRL